MRDETMPNICVDVIYYDCMFMCVYPNRRQRDGKINYGNISAIICCTNMNLYFKYGQTIEMLSIHN